MLINRVKLIAEMARQRVGVAELAEKAGISRVTLTAVRDGKSCHKTTAGHIARALGVTIEYLTEEE